MAISLYLSFALPVFFGAIAAAALSMDASNIVGPWAYTHGLTAAALGLFFDFIVSWCWVAAFTLLYLNAAAVRRAPALFGLAFGVVVMPVMIFLVVPLGHAAARLDQSALAAQHAGRAHRLLRIAGRAIGRTDCARAAGR